MPKRKNFINPPPGEPPTAGAPADVIHTDFASRLQRILTLKGWNQAELARRAVGFLPPGSKIGRDNISGYVRGVALPGPIKLDAIARALGVETTELLPRKAVPSAGDRALPPLDMRDTGDGNVWLRVNQSVSRKIALQIMNLLMGEGSAVPATQATPKKGRQQQSHVPDDDEGQQGHDGRRH